MKKLMKAIAFATVMCMLLSTAAFAANTATMVGTSAADVKVDILVEAGEAAKGQAIALVVAKSSVNSAADLDSTNILYIDQSVIPDTGIAAFEGVDTKGENPVNVFVGYEANDTGAALKLVAEELVFEAGDTITVTTLALYQNLEGEEANNDLGGGFVVDFTANLDEGRTISKLIWALDWTKKVNGEVVGADTAYIVADDMIEDINYLSGTTRLGVAFAAGAKKWGKHTVELGESVRAIVKTTGGNLPDKEFVPEEDVVKGPQNN